MVGQKITDVSGLLESRLMIIGKIGTTDQYKLL